MSLELFDVAAVERLLRVDSSSDLTLGSNKQGAEGGTAETFGLSEKKTKKATKEIYEELLELQQKLFAEKKQSVLIVFQAMVDHELERAGRASAGVW